MSGKPLTLHYHKGTHRNIPVRRAGFDIGARQYADFAVLWGLMPDQLVLPRVEAESVTTEQKGAVRRRQWGSERRSEPLSIVHPRPSRRKIILGRLGILTTLAAWIAYVISTILKELADNPNAGFRFQFETISYLVVVTFLTFSALMYLLARQGALYRFRDHPGSRAASSTATSPSTPRASRSWCPPTPKNPRWCAQRCGPPPSGIPGSASGPAAG